MAEAFIYNNKNDYYPLKIWPLSSGLRYGIYVQLTSKYYFLESLKIKLVNYGAPVGLLTAEVYRATIIGAVYQPTGPILATGWILQQDIEKVGAYYDIAFDNNVLLSPVSEGPDALIVMFHASQAGPFTNFTANLLSLPVGLGWGSNGIAGHSIYTGGEWQRLTTSDPIFEAWGELYIPRNPARPDADLPSFPDTRPDGYAPNDFWIPGEWDGDTYTPPEWAGATPGRYFATGGGRWGQQLVAVGHGLIYYEELT